MSNPCSHACFPAIIQIPLSTTLMGQWYSAFIHHLLQMGIRLNQILALTACFRTTAGISMSRLALIYSWLSDLCASYYSICFLLEVIMPFHSITFFSSFFFFFSFFYWNKNLFWLCGKMPCPCSGQDYCQFCWYRARLQINKIKFIKETVKFFDCLHSVTENAKHICKLYKTASVHIFPCWFHSPEQHKDLVTSLASQESSNKNKNPPQKTTLFLSTPSHCWVNEFPILLTYPQTKQC